MACFKPLAAWRAPGGGVSFSLKSGFADRPVELACGQCIGCRLARTRSWAARLVHEAQAHPVSSFLTLTYADAPVSLDRREFPNFMRRLRREISAPVRYFHVGEYGELTSRPHYHAILFGYAFLADRRAWSCSSSGHPMWRSAQLERIWGKGYCSIGAVTPATAAYCARYVCKKVTGEGSAEHYGNRIPEFMTCSKGIGRQWIERFHADTYRDDFIVLDEKKASVPRYYDKVMSSINPELLRKAQLNRICRASGKEARANATRERLSVREEVTAARLNSRPRGQL